MNRKIYKKDHFMNKDEYKISDFRAKNGISNQDYLAIYKTLNDSRIDYNVRKWETLRTTSIIVFGMLTGIIASATTEFARKQIVFIMLGALAIITGVSISIWTYMNLRRETENQYFNDFSMFQIEKILGMHQKLKPNESWLPNFPYMFGDLHLDYLSHSEIKNNEAGYLKNPVKAWVTGRIRENRFRFVGYVFWYSIILAVLSIGIGSILLIIGIWGNQLLPLTQDIINSKVYIIKLLP